MKNPRKLSTNSCRAGRSCGRILCAALVSSSIVFLCAGLPMAQTESGDSPLLPYIGVWTITASRSATGTPVPNSTVEIRPTSDRKGLEISRKTTGQPDISETVIPDGTKRPMNPQNCSGWRSAQWVSEAGMILESSEVTCKDTGSLVTSTLKMIVAADQMAEILSIKAAGQQPRIAVRRLTFDHDLPPTPDLPPVWVAASARTALSGNWTLDKIIQLSKEVDTQLLEAAMIEKKIKPNLNSQSLKQMQTANLPRELIDLTVALAYPTQFHIEKNGQVELRPWLDSSTSGSAAATTAYEPMAFYPGAFYNCYSPYGYFGYTGLSMLAPGNCWSYYSPMWWDYPFSVTPVVIGNNTRGRGNAGVPVTNPGGYAFVEPIQRYARPRGDYFPRAGGSGGSGSSGQSGSYGTSSAGSAGSSGGSSGGGSSAPGASPGGYSGGGGGGGGHAVPR